jgi:hypothetical protein
LGGWAFLALAAPVSSTAHHPFIMVSSWFTITDWDQDKIPCPSITCCSTYTLWAIRLAGNPSLVPRVDGTQSRHTDHPIINEILRRILPHTFFLQRSNIRLVPPRVFCRLVKPNLGKQKILFLNPLKDSLLSPSQRSIVCHKKSTAWASHVISAPQPSLCVGTTPQGHDQAAGRRGRGGGVSPRTRHRRHALRSSGVSACHLSCAINVSCGRMMQRVTVMPAGEPTAPVGIPKAQSQASLCMHILQE